jgi:hypothetical protein
MSKNRGQEKEKIIGYNDEAFILQKCKINVRREPS